jgi:hypothetical protein
MVSFFNISFEHGWKLKSNMFTTNINNKIRDIDGTIVTTKSQVFQGRIDPENSDTTTDKVQRINM